MNISLADCYWYVIQQIDDLKNYIDDNLCCCIACCMICPLWLAQECLKDAYVLIENGKITCGLLHDAIAQVLIAITECETEFFHKSSFIRDEDAEYIISSLHTIRDNIVFLLGASIDYGLDISFGYDIATIEVKLLNLNDFIDEEIKKYERESLEDLIVLAAIKLEIAIFKISLDDEINNTLTIAQNYLDFSIIEVNLLYNEGKISQDLADTLLLKINEVKMDIEIVKDSI